MIAGITLKVCGLTTVGDAQFAAAGGVDYLGFNLYPQSPRYLPLEKYKAFSARLPALEKVAILVTPTAAELATAAAAGFDRFQVHFSLETAAAVVGSWAETVGVSRLWLAPKLPPASDVPAALLPFAKTFLLDTFHAGGFGGSGKTGDWAKFARHAQRHEDKTWILAGGLNPENIATAVTRSGARFVDVNSGVESAPGVKDEAKLRRLAANLAVHRE
jgi:phosphoribosylanthranilate isomerase